MRPAGDQQQMERADAGKDGDDGSEVTLIVTRVVHHGCEDRFRDWADRVAARAHRVDGHCGELSLEQAGGLFHLIHRFADSAALHRWEGSGDYRRLMAEGDRFSTPRRQVVAGERPAARLPSDADSPKWKRFVMTWAAVLPLVVTLNLALAALPGSVPRPVQSAISSAIMVATMTWLILPFVSRRLKPWVLRDGDGQARVAAE